MEPSLQPHDLPALEDPAKALAAAQNIDLRDPSLSVTFGAETMTEIARFSDTLLSRVRTKDAGAVGETLGDLMLKVKDLDLGSLSGEGGSFWEKLPLVGALFNSVERSVSRFNTVAEQIEIISAKLDEAMTGLLKDIEILEGLYGHNKNFHEALSLHIAAGKLALEHAAGEELPRLQKEAAESGDGMKAQEVRDFAEKINRFERRLHDLQLSRTVTLQTAPQIRIIQSNNQTLAEKIQTGILSTIPLWKSQMVLALSLHGQQKAAKLQKDVADTTNELLKKNASMLETAAIDTAREVERAAVDMDTIREVHQKLIHTIEETLRIATEGRDRRRESEKELAALEQSLRDNLTMLASDRQRQVISGAEGAASSHSAPVLPASEDGK